MTDLIARLESAAEGQQRDLILDCLNLAYGRKWVSDLSYAKAIGWCMKGAYESAALTLVPDGCAWRVGQRLDDRKPDAAIQRRGTDKPFDIWVESEAATPALAICAAALKARKEETP